MKKYGKCLIAIFATLIAIPLGFLSNTKSLVHTESINYGYGLNLTDKCDFDEEKLTKVDLDSVNDVTTIPAQYNMNDEIYIQVEDQKKYGICWSFSSLTTLETYIAKQYNEYYQFSAIHQATSKFVEDNFNNGSVDFFTPSNAGGNIYNFLSYISHNAGPVLEEQMPFSDFFGSNSSIASTKGTAAKQYYNTYKNNFDKLVSIENVKLFADSTQLSTDLLKQTNRNAIKEHLLNKSACSTNIYMPNMLSVNSSDGSYYLSSIYGTSYTDDTKSYVPNHMVTIIGWNDNYTISGYSNPGAWLIQNSWGNSYTYFYVSYYDYNVETLVFGINNANLTTPNQNSFSNIQDLQGYTPTNFSLQKNNFTIAIVTDVSAYKTQYISGVATSVYSNSGDSDAYKYYLYFTDNASYSEITIPKNCLVTTSTKSSMIDNDSSLMYGDIFSTATFDTPQQITHKYAVLIINVKQMFNFFCFYSTIESSDITQKLYVYSNNTFSPIGFGNNIKRSVVPVFFYTKANSTNLDTVGNFSTQFPESIDDNSSYIKNNATFVANTINIPVVSPSTDITDFSVYTQKYYNQSLVLTDYTNNFTMLATQDEADNTLYKISITQNNSLAIDDYILSFKIGNKVFKKMFSITDELSYPIHYELNGGKNNSNTPTAYTSSNTKITLYNPSRAGYNFDGWYLDNSFNVEASGDTGVNEHGNYLVFDIPTGSQSLSFYAKWQLLEPDIATQPNSISKIYDKKSANLTVEATHGLGQNSLSYQWYFSTNGTNYTPKLNAKSSTLAITNVAESGTYKCVITVTDSNGITKTVESNATEVAITKAEYKNLDWDYSTPYSFDAQQKEVKIKNNYPDDLEISYTGNKGINANNYQAIATVVNKNENFVTPNISPLNWTINKAKLTVNIKSFDFETKDGFDNFSTSLCKHTISGTIFDNYQLNIVYVINDTTNENLKIINATYTQNDNYDVTIVAGKVRLIRYSMSFNSDDTTITVNRDKGYLIDAKLNVEVLTEQDLEAQEQKFLADKKLTAYNIYNIAIDGDTLEETMTVSISISPDLKDKNLQVFISTADGLKLVNSNLVDGYITFNTSQLGTFVIVEAPEDLGLKEILIGAGIVLGAGLLVCIFIGLIKTRRKKRLISSSPINTPH